MPDSIPQYQIRIADSNPAAVRALLHHPLLQMIGDGNIQIDQGLSFD